MRVADNLQAVVFRLGDEEFGIDITQVREIDKLVRVTRVPRVPSFVEGIINLRGQLVPVLDLRTRLGLRHEAPPKSARIVVAEIEGRTFGMIVDEVREVVRIPGEQIVESHVVLEGLATEYVGAVAKIEERLIILLDVAKVLAGAGEQMPEALAAEADKD
jgi:purine-binding chemotaxis protein CheW